MKLSWTSLKISIAGAKLSHLVQKDKIWDHGSMAEQARIIFYLVHKAKANGTIESLERHCSISCFEKLKMMAEEKPGYIFLNDPIIKELAVLEVQPRKATKPDMFTALIKGISKDGRNNNEIEFASHWSFVRQGEWWLLNETKSQKLFGV